MVLSSLQQFVSIRSTFLSSQQLSPFSTALLQGKEDKTLYKFNAWIGITENEMSCVYCDLSFNIF